MKFPRRDPEDFERLLMLSALVLSALAVILYVVCGLAGCAQAPGGVTTGNFGDAAKLVGDIDDALTRPDLPDDLADKNSGSANAAPAKPLIVVYAPSWCSGCKPKVAALEKELGDRFRFEIHDDSRSFPEWTANVGGYYPILAWRVPGKPRNNWFYINDLSTPARVEKQYRLTLPAEASGASRPAGAAYRAVRTNSNQYAREDGYPVRSRGSWWTHPGHSRRDLIRHLQHDGIHRGRFNAGYLETLSMAELESLHADDHSGRLRRTSSVVRRTQARCPTCPRGT